MAKFKISAGAEVDMLTQKELHEALDKLSAAWMAEVTRGFKYRRFLASAPIVGAAVSIQEGQDNTLGPSGGLIWAVNSITVAGLAVNDTLDMFINGTDPIGSVARLTTSTGQYPTVRFTMPEIVLNPGDTLTFSASGLTSTASQIAVFGRCTELSHTLAYKLV